MHAGGVEVQGARSSSIVPRFGVTDDATFNEQRPYRDPRGPSAQPEGHRRRHSPAPAHRRDRRERLGQVDASRSTSSTPRVSDATSRASPPTRGSSSSAWRSRDVDHVGGIPPAVAIDQRKPVKTSRSTVGTMTEIHDHLKLLFAKLGVLQCRGCGCRVERATPTGVAQQLLREQLGAAVLLGFPFPLPDLPWPDVVAALAREGFTRARLDGAVHTLDGVAAAPAIPLDIVVDRLTLKRETRARLVASLEQALTYGKGRCWVARVDDGRRLEFSTALACTACGIAYRDPTPNLFSFNSPLGACERAAASAASSTSTSTSWSPTRRARSRAVRSSRGQRRRRARNAATSWRSAPPHDPDRRALRAPRSRAASARRGGRRQVLRHPRLVPLARAQDLQDARPGPALALSLATASARRARAAASKPDALDFRVGGRSIADVNRMNVADAARVRFGVSTSTPRRTRPRPSSSARSARGSGIWSTSGSAI